MYDIGTFLCSGDLDLVKGWIAYNGFTKEDIRLIIDKDYGIASAVAKKSSLSIRTGFIISQS